MYGVDWIIGFDWSIWGWYYVSSWGSSCWSDWCGWYGCIGSWGYGIGVVINGYGV